MAREKKLQLPDDVRHAFVRYADARSDLELLRGVAMFNVGVEIGLVVGRGQPRARNTLRPQARMQLQRALGTAAKALRRNGLSGFADDVASVVRVAVALAAGPASIVDVRRAAKRLAYRKRAR